MDEMKYSQDSIWAKRNFLDFLQDTMDSTAETSACSDNRNIVNDRDMEKSAIETLELALKILKDKRFKFTATNLLKLPKEQLQKLLEEERGQE